APPTPGPVPTPPASAKQMVQLMITPNNSRVQMRVKGGALVEVTGTSVELDPAVTTMFEISRDGYCKSTASWPEKGNAGPVKVALLSQAIDNCGRGLTAVTPAPAPTATVPGPPLGVMVIGNPSWTVKIDGAMVGPTNQSYTVAPGPHTFTQEDPTGSSLPPRSVTITEDKQKVNLNLAQ
ncbi:MAG: hypothetical protein ABMB14_05310, partial [Myxococcota bacterium]